MHGVFTNVMRSSVEDLLNHIGTLDTTQASKKKSRSLWNSQNSCISLTLNSLCFLVSCKAIKEGRLFRFEKRFNDWSQNLNRITFDPLFGIKTVENRQNRVFWPVFGLFFNKKCSDVIGYQFWNHICIPLIKANLLGPKMKGDWRIYFWPPIKVSKLGY